MKEFRSKSYKDERMQTESYYYYGGGKSTPPPTTMHDLRRCDSANHHPGSSNPNPNQDPNREARMKKSKSGGGGAGSSNWSLSEPELQRMRRVASYRVYAVEGKVKGSLKKGLRWIKNTCTHVVDGWW